jgi:hypothetical protein
MFAIWNSDSEALYLFIIFFIFIYFSSIFENMKIASQTSLGIYTLFSIQLIVFHPGKNRDLLYNSISSTAQHPLLFGGIPNSFFISENSLY